MHLLIFVLKWIYLYLISICFRLQISIIFIQLCTPTQHSMNVRPKNTCFRLKQVVHELFYIPKEYILNGISNNNEVEFKIYDSVLSQWNTTFLLREYGCIITTNINLRNMHYLIKQFKILHHRKRFARYCTQQLQYCSFMHIY